MLTRTSANQPLTYNGTPYRDESASTVVSFTFEVRPTSGYVFRSKCITIVNGQYQQVSKVREEPIAHPEYIMSTLTNAVKDILTEAHGELGFSKIYNKISDYFDENSHQLKELLSIVNKL